MPIANLSNPIHSLHQSRNAEFQSYGGAVEIVATFGEPQAEYAAIRKAAALMDLPQRGVIELSGNDRHAFLGNLITNQVWDKASKQGLQPGQGVYAFYLNTKGRIVADMNVLELGDRLLIDVDARIGASFETSLTKYVFAEKVKIRNLTGTLHHLALHGPEAHTVLADFGNAPPLDPLADLASTELTFDGASITVFRDDACGVPGFHLLIPAERAPAIWTSLLDRFASPLELGKRRLRPVGWAAFNACRIEAGRPLFDIDFGNSADPEQSTLPAETGKLFARAVSVTKGCYLGQEIVARMYARGQVAKQLTGLRVDGDALPIAGAPVLEAAGDNQLGMVTSSTMSPMLSDAPIAIAMIKKPAFASGTRVRVPAEGAFRDATVVELPFVGTNHN
ncbi:MAG TPA: aminomethyltransferase family protein [Tepidisphaeraceae bacterium]|nr:aminomethyltransferase family protein [Tepidisphaeraceae bacterium]